MKTALIISGQPRNIELGFPSHKTWILDKFNPDVFVHTWFDKSVIGEQFVNEGGHTVTKPVSEDVIKTIVDLYDPVSVKFEKPKPDGFYDMDPEHHNKMFPAITLYANYSMYYSMYQSFLLMEESGNEYDVVIRLRFDWEIHNIPTVQFEPNTVYAPNDAPHKLSFSDQFAFGDYNAMSAYCKSYEDMRGLCERVYRIVAEPIQHLRLTEMGVNMHPLPIQYRIIKTQ